MSFQTTIDHLRSVAPTLESESDLDAFLSRASALAVNPVLRLVIDMLAEMPPEVAGKWSARIATLGAMLHPDTTDPALCRAVALGLSRFASDAPALASQPDSVESLTGLQGALDAYARVFLTHEKPWARVKVSREPNSRDWGYHFCYHVEIMAGEIVLAEKSSDTIDDAGDSILIELSEHAAK